MLCTSFSVMAVCCCDVVSQINRDNCTKIGVVLCDFPTGICLGFVLILSFKKRIWLRPWLAFGPFFRKKPPTATCRVNLCKQTQAHSAWDKAKKMSSSQMQLYKSKHTMFFTLMKQTQTNPVCAHSTILSTKWLSLAQLCFSLALILICFLAES